MPETSLPQAHRTVLRDVTWEAYEAILHEYRDGGPRICYDRGVLEIVSPLRKHDWQSRILGRLVEILTLEAGIPISSARSTTIKSQLKKRGVEPDESYFVQHEPDMRLKDEYDIAVDPPPDLAIEVDLTSSSIHKLGVYAAFGVPELWIHDGSVKILLLSQGGEYVEAPRSLALPQLTPQILDAFLVRRKIVGEAALVLEFRDWVHGGMGTVPFGV